MSISRFTLLGAVLAAACLAAPAWATDLAASVAGKLRDSGALSGYRVNVKSKAGTVWLEGRVADQQQLAAAVGIAEATPGVERVVNRLVIDGGAQPPAGGLAVPSSAWNLAGVPQPAAPVAQPSRNPFTAMTALFAGGEEPQPTGDVRLTQAMQPVRQMPPMAQARPMQPPRPAGQRTAMRTSAGEVMTLPAPGYDGPVMDGQMVPGSMQYTDGTPVAGPGMVGGPGMAGPMPMATAGVGMPPVPMRADGPNMPNYAWPSYAANPNYAAVQYPTQYSPTAWPYIGPFYPYPQVPLGWRRVSLEWDDGWWWLDFDERHIHNHHK